MVAPDIAWGLSVIQSLWFDKLAAVPVFNSKGGEVHLWIDHTGSTKIHMKLAENPSYNELEEFTIFD